MNTAKYRVILADPPWSYNNSGTRGAAANHYPTMSIDDICALPVTRLAAPDCALFLWATWPLLPEAMRVIQSWGFEYVSGFPWIKIIGHPSVSLWGELEIKTQYGVGFWVRGASEPLLIARRGNVSPGNGQFVGLLSENLRHSRKPENIYHIIEKLDGPYLELFARRPRTGWTSFGNEIDGDDEVHKMLTSKDLPL